MASSREMDAVEPGLIHTKVVVSSTPVRGSYAKSPAFIAALRLKSYADGLDPILRIASIPHPCVSRVVASSWWPEQQRLVSVVEASPHSLYRLAVRSGVKNEPPIRRRAQLARLAAKGLKHLHDNGIIHGELIHDRVMVSRELDRAHIVCFGNHEDRFRSPIQSQFAVTAANARYLAPEVLQAHLDGKRLPVSRARDVYAFGVILWELFHEQRAWSHAKTPSAVASVVLAGGVPQSTVTCPSRVSALVAQCLDSQATKRPTMEVILKELEHIIVDVTLQDHAARQLWKQHFWGRDVVSWPLFARAIAELYGFAICNRESATSQDPSVNEEVRREAFKLECLQNVLVTRGDTSSSRKSHAHRSGRSPSSSASSARKTGKKNPPLIIIPTSSPSLSASTSSFIAPSDRSPMVSPSVSPQSSPRVKAACVEPLSDDDIPSLGAPTVPCVWDVDLPRTQQGSPQHADDTGANACAATQVGPDSIGTEEVVRITTLGKVLSCLGPLNDTFLDRLQSLMKERWFHGVTSQQEADARLVAQRPRTFLLRFSNRPGFFVLSFVDDTQTPVHYRITCTASGYHVHSSIVDPSKKTSTLEHRAGIKEIIDDARSNFVLDAPCPHPPHEHLFDSSRPPDQSLLEIYAYEWNPDEYVHVDISDLNSPMPGRLDGETTGGTDQSSVYLSPAAPRVPFADGS